MLMLNISQMRQVNKMLEAAEKELSKFIGKDITLTLVYADRRINIDEFNSIAEHTKDLVAKEFFVTKRALESSSRQDELPHARMMYYQLMKMQFPRITLKKLGSLLNRKDHSTIINALEQFEDMKLCDKGFALRYFELMNQLNIK